MNMLDLGPAARRLADLIAEVKDGDLGKPTPCPAYTLGDLIDHVGGLALAFTAAAGKARGQRTEQGPSGDGSRLREDWRMHIPRDLAALVQAWRSPEAWDGMTRIAGMDAPAAMVGLTVADELVVHGWDLARATEQPYSCEPALLEAAEHFLAQVTSADVPTGPRVPFGPPRPVPAGAATLDRVVALAGRDPAWSPSGASVTR